MNVGYDTHTVLYDDPRYLTGVGGPVLHHPGALVGVAATYLKELVFVFYSTVWWRNVYASGAGRRIVTDDPNSYVAVCSDCNWHSGLYPEESRAHQAGGNHIHDDREADDDERLSDEDDAHEYHLEAGGAFMDWPEQPSRREDDAYRAACDTCQWMSGPYWNRDYAEHAEERHLEESGGWDGMAGEFRKPNSDHDTSVESCSWEALLDP